MLQSLAYLVYDLSPINPIKAHASCTCDKMESENRIKYWEMHASWKA